MCKMRLKKLKSANLSIRHSFGGCAVFMEDDASGFFKKSSTSHTRLDVLALMQVTTLAIITIRRLDLLMIFNTLGFCETSELIHRSVQTWNLTLVSLGSPVLLFIETYCTFSLVKGRNWACWIYLLTQVIASVYLRATSLGYGYPELFDIAGESRHEILYTLIIQKLPDMLVLLLLFAPASSRRFSRLQ